MTEIPEQGARAGRNFPAEDETYTDPATGATVRRLTGYPDTDDYHLYFTEDGWYDDGRRLLFRSDRAGDRQLFSIDLESGLITQVTDVADFRGGTSIDHDASAAYVRVGEAVVRLDLDRFVFTDVLYESPEGYNLGDMDVNADGSALYLAVGEDVDVPRDDDWFDAMVEAKPHTQILRVPIDGGEPEVLQETERWASSHVNASPTRPELFMYAEEGPWAVVENRIWTMNAETGETWQLRDVPEAGGVGHEYWLQDGERVGYHGSLDDPQGRARVDEPDPFMGSVRYDDTDRREMDLPQSVYALTHSHANTPKMHVCDGSFTDVPYAIVYRYNEATESYDGPHKLATVDWREGSPHPHSRFSPDGEQVLFDSARYDGSSNLYLVDVPAFEDLPAYDPGE